MTLQNFLQNFPVIQWAILLLSVSIAVRTLMSAVQLLISLKSSTLSKSQKQSLQNFLTILSNCSTEIIPNLSEALRTALSNKGLLSLPSQSNLEEIPAQETTAQETTAQLQADDEDSALDKFLDFVKAFKEVKK